MTPEQEMLRDAARDALSRLPTITAARDGLDGAPPVDMWPTACEAGWTGLLIPESHGGAGLSPFDAMLVLEQCGRRLTGAGLLGHLPATLLLSRAAERGDASAAELLPAAASGEKRLAIVHAPEAQLSSDGLLTGRADFQPDAAGADFLVMAALVDATAPGVEIEPAAAYDASRAIAHVRLDHAPAHALPLGADDLAEAWYVGQALLAADALGVVEEMLERSVAYAKERYTFGRPIGSYQAIKQQIVEILRHAGTTRSLCLYAALAFDGRREDVALAASAARFAAEEASDYATRTCIAVHGGIGATWEHDAHLYWRRAQLSRLLLGGVGDAGERVAEEIIGRAADRVAASTN
jgi:alkylation response protein AidB-like acyl-CoA dehydrogenase